MSYSAKQYAEVIGSLIDNKENKFSVEQMSIIRNAINKEVDPYLIAFYVLSTEDMSALLGTLVGDRAPNYKKYNYILACTLGKTMPEFTPIADVIKLANDYTETTLWHDGVYERILKELQAANIEWHGFVQLVKCKNIPMTPLYARVDSSMRDTNYIHAFSYAANAYVGREAIKQCTECWNSVIAEYYTKALNDGVPTGLLNLCIRDCSMSKIEYARRAWIKGIDLTGYVEVYPARILEAITEFLDSGVSPDDYLDLGLSAGQLSIIVCGLRKGLDVRQVMNPSFDVLKMTYLLKLMEFGKSVVPYLSEEYTWKELKLVVEELV